MTEAVPDNVQALIDAAVQQALEAQQAAIAAVVAEQEKAAQEADAQAAQAADEELAAQVAVNQKWEGHSHKWGKADDKGLRTCKECPLILPADLIEEG